MNKEFKIKSVTIDDVTLILYFIKELTEYEKLLNEELFALFMTSELEKDLPPDLDDERSNLKKIAH